MGRQVRKKRLAEMTRAHGAGPIKVTVPGYETKAGGVLEFGKLHVEYTIELRTALKTQWTIHKRYSELDKLHQAAN